jgi:hypothetical protein
MRSYPVHSSWGHHGSLACVSFLVAAAFLVEGLRAARADAPGNETGAERSELAFCQVSARAGCQCSFATLETPFTFGEAATIISLFYDNFPDERYSRLLETFLRQCAGEPRPEAAAQPTVTIKSDIAAVPPASTQPRALVKGGRP